MLLSNGFESTHFLISNGLKEKTRLRTGEAGFYWIYLAAPLPYPGNPGFRPVALRPNLSEGLPFSKRI